MFVGEAEIEIRRGEGVFGKGGVDFLVVVAEIRYRGLESTEDGGDKGEKLLFGGKRRGEGELDEELELVGN